MAEDIVAREKFASRLGFILISAGCAIGLGNIWRFPYITGEYGGAAFVIMYLVFLVILGLPVMVMEFSVGRASQRSTATAFNILQPSGKWNWFGWVTVLGCLILMMFYTTVCGWFLNYVVKMATGTFNGLDPDGVANVFGTMMGSPSELIAWMLFVVILGFLVCSLGLQKGVERITKFMMVCLLILLVVLVVRAVTLPGAEAGLEFYLMPDFGALFAGDNPAAQWGHFGEAVYAAMGQAFFTLSLGIGSMEIFGSYIDKDRSITGESLRICGLDTFVALMAGLIIFPACLAFGVSPDAGPSLVFITLPSVFEMMPLGQLWGSLFFLFMSFAALSTVIAVFEMLLAWSMDKWGLTRRQVVVRTAVRMTTLRRESPHLSMLQARRFSNTAMTVESAAKLMNRKKSEPHSWPRGICSNTEGSVMNTSDGPASGLTPNARQAGKMMRPAMRATKVSRPQMRSDSPVMERSLSI